MNHGLNLRVNVLKLGINSLIKFGWNEKICEPNQTGFKKNHLATKLQSKFVGIFSMYSWYVTFFYVCLIYDIGYVMFHLLIQRP